MVMLYTPQKEPQNAAEFWAFAFQIVVQFEVTCLKI